MYHANTARDHINQRNIVSIITVSIMPFVVIINDIIFQLLLTFQLFYMIFLYSTKYHFKTLLANKTTRI